MFAVILWMQIAAVTLSKTFPEPSSYCHEPAANTCLSMYMHSNNQRNKRGMPTWLGVAPITTTQISVVAVVGPMCVRVIMSVCVCVCVSIFTGGRTDHHTHLSLRGWNAATPTDSFKAGAQQQSLLSCCHSCDATLTLLTSTTAGEPE